MALSKDGYSKRVVISLYKALARGDTEMATRVLAPDLEWWFHGPPHRQHMMRVLTGEEGHEDFRFVPRRVAEVGEWVAVEGWEGEQDYWVHLWAVEEGRITRFREYFNTWVTVRELGQAHRMGWARRRARGDSGPPVWQSQARDHVGRSLPALVFAI